MTPQPSLLDQATSFFVSAFQYPGLDLRFVPVAVALAIAFGAIWLLAYRPTVSHGGALVAVATASAALTWSAISFVQVPLQSLWGQGLLAVWNESTIATWVLLAAIPTMLISGLVQEAAKLLPVLAYRARTADAFDPRTGLVVGLMAGAGFGVFEAVWAHNIAFASGAGFASLQDEGLAALEPFAERFLAVGFHIALTGLAAYGAATGRGRRFFLIAACLHGAGNYVIVLAAQGLVDTVGMLVYMALLTAGLSAVVLRLRGHGEGPRAHRSTRPVEATPAS